MNVEVKMRAPFLTVPDFGSSGKIIHAFTTRRNGLGARNNGIKQVDDWRDVAASFGIGLEKLVTVNQVHGDEIVRISEMPHSAGGYQKVQADGIITDLPGLAVGVETADCVPVLLYDPRRPVVAAVHAGWRSSLKRIVQKAVVMMRTHYDCDPHGMMAAIGPAIGPECYEVDEAVMGPLQEEFAVWKKIASQRPNGRWSLDLVHLNRIQLAETGFSQKNIHALGLCTSCRRDLFYSFRTEGRTGRMLSVIMLKP
ncbi:MAG: hypothetical protein A2X56_05065 [Nitrospirae bacterium GWC2_57_13]|jgi:polyphenol oxidase|nr:MAG: hypothetical protein A2X56_05065 [Nitrospirae bacterium GWC2_57_13]